MKLSEKIIHLRKTKGWSQEELAERLNISRQAISRWENETALPDAYNIVQLSKLFGVTADYLLKEDCTITNGTVIEDVAEVDKTCETTRTQNKKRSIAHLVTSIIFLISAVIFLILAICELEIIYVLLMLPNAIISLVNIIFYEKTRIKK